MSKPKIFKNKNAKQFLSYVVVGGAATLVEWGLFFLFTYPLSFNHNLSFTIAFIVSTAVNMILGKIMTFKNAAVINAGDNKKLNIAKETFLIYLVAVIGYALNLLILNLLTELFSMNEMIAKMIATLIVFFWNYFARKLGIYRTPQKVKTAHEAN